MFSWLKRVLGVPELEKRVKALESRLDRLVPVDPEGAGGPETEVTPAQEEIMGILKEPMTTETIAEKLNKGRSWISSLINDLERDGRVREVGKEGKSILYAVV